jgi:hypothetical protein
MMPDRVGERPIWLNSAGAGAAWFHVRLDLSPKYYSHRPYKSRPEKLARKGSLTFSITCRGRTVVVELASGPEHTTS